MKINELFWWVTSRCDMLSEPAPKIIFFVSPHVSFFPVLQKSHLCHALEAWVDCHMHFLFSMNSLPAQWYHWNRSDSCGIWTHTFHLVRLRHFQFFTLREQCSSKEWILWGSETLNTSICMVNTLPLVNMLPYVWLICCLSFFINV